MTTDFKRGDLVRFKDPNSDNTRFFKEGLTGLEVKSVGTHVLCLYEQSKSNCWDVSKDEVELDTPPEKQSFFDNTLPLTSRLWKQASYQRLLENAQETATKEGYSISIEAQVVIKDQILTTFRKEKLPHVIFR